MSSVPMFDPSGKVRAVPASSVDAATQAGGKLAVKMLDPNQAVRWVPETHVDRAVQAGGQHIPHPEAIKEAILKKASDWWKQERTYSSSTDLTHSNVDAAFFNTLAAIPGWVKDTAGDVKDVVQGKMRPEQMFSQDLDPGNLIDSLQKQFRSDWSVDKGAAVQKLAGTLAALGVTAKAAGATGEAAGEFRKYAENQPWTGPEGEHGFIDLRSDDPESLKEPRLPSNRPLSQLSAGGDPVNIVRQMQSGPGNYVRLDKLRAQLGNMPKSEFDQKILDLVKKGELIPGRYEGPRPIPEGDKHAYIEGNYPDGERFAWMSVAIPRR